MLTTSYDATGKHVSGPVLIDLLYARAFEDDFNELTAPTTHSARIVPYPCNKHVRNAMVHLETARALISPVISMLMLAKVHDDMDCACSTTVPVSISLSRIGVVSRKWP